MAGEWRTLSEHLIEHTENGSRVSKVKLDNGWTEYWAYRRVPNGYELIKKYANADRAKAAAARATNAEA